MEPSTRQTIALRSAERNLQSVDGGTWSTGEGCSNCSSALNDNYGNLYGDLTFTNDDTFTSNYPTVEMVNKKKSEDEEDCVCETRGEDDDSCVCETRGEDDDSCVCETPGDGTQTKTSDAKRLLDRMQKIESFIKSISGQFSKYQKKNEKCYSEIKQQHKQNYDWFKMLIDDLSQELERDHCDNKFVEESEKFILKEKKIKDRIEEISQRKTELEEKLNEMNKKIEEMQMVLNETTPKYEEINARITALENDEGKSSKNVTSNVSNEEIKTLEQRVDELNGKIDLNTQSIDTNNEDMKVIKQNINQLTITQDLHETDIQEMKGMANYTNESIDYFHKRDNEIKLTQNRNIESNAMKRIQERVKSGRFVEQFKGISYESINKQEKGIVMNFILEGVSNQYVCSFYSQKICTKQPKQTNFEYPRDNVAYFFLYDSINDVLYQEQLQSTVGIYIDVTNKIHFGTPSSTNVITSEYVIIGKDLALFLQKHIKSGDIFEMKEKRDIDYLRVFSREQVDMKDIVLSKKNEIQQTKTLFYFPEINKKEFDTIIINPKYSTLKIKENNVSNLLLVTQNIEKYIVQLQTLASRGPTRFTDVLHIICSVIVQTRETVGTKTETRNEMRYFGISTTMQGIVYAKEYRPFVYKTDKKGVKTNVEKNCIKYHPNMGISYGFDSIQFNKGSNYLTTPLFSITSDFKAVFNPMIAKLFSSELTTQTSSIYMSMKSYPLASLSLVQTKK